LRVKPVERTQEVFSPKFVRPVAVAILAVVAAVAVPTPGHASVAHTSSASAATPAVIQPPVGSIEVARYRVKVGFQIYRCVNSAWILKAPAAMLLNSDRDGRTIYHYGGPTWQSMTDGSLVTAVKKAEVSIPGTIPHLLLEVISHGGTAGGELSNVSHLQRLNTKGGLAPSGGCVDGSEQPVPYGADYVLFEPATA
jgi:hypothetical protein